KSAYNRLNHSPTSNSDITHFSSSIWKSKAPLKRLFMNRIPTKTALSRQGVTFSHGGGLLCPFCNDDLEYSWKAWSTIWFATVWAIWRHRNDIIFNKVRLFINHILETARLWIKNILGVEFSLYSDWLSKPLLCLNITM
ncbi:hypothetical protein Lal_00022966, partial [Lupinus albus]